MALLKVLGVNWHPNALANVQVDWRWEVPAAEPQDFLIVALVYVLHTNNQEFITIRVCSATAIWYPLPPSLVDQLVVK